MKIFIISLLLLFSISYSQDSISIAIEDWEEAKITALQIDSALTDCEQLNTIYERRFDEFSFEIMDLRGALAKSDTIIAQKDSIITLQGEKEEVFEDIIFKKNVEIWIDRIVIVGLIILLL